MKPASNKHAKSNTQPTMRQWRFGVVIGTVCLVFSGLVARAAFIQVIEPDLLIKRGDNRTLRTRNMPVHRGLILDRNGEELAVSVPVRAVWADPKIIHENQSLSDKRRWKALAEVLGQDVKKLQGRLQDPKRRFVYIERQVSPAMARYVEQLDIPGVYLRNESRRYYPAGEVSAHLVGFTNVDDKGIEGIERLYDDWLTGTPGSRKIRRDAKGRQVEILDEKQGEEPQNIQLTIDQRIQALTYKELKKAVRYFKATSGSAVVVDVKSGEILALVNSPSFNPNNRKGATPHRIRNRAITDAYEPGSTMKPMAVLSALEFGSVNIDEEIDTAPGYMRLGGRVVQDSRNYGTLDLTGIIRKSSNMGTSKLALSVPKEFLIDMYYNMGLIGDSGTNLIGESNGLFRARRRWSDFELATLSFGYSIAVTPVQLARMYSTIANGGINRPLSVIKQNTQAEGERVLSRKNALAVMGMMEHVVLEGGTAPKARVPGYRVAGKTGTSKKAVAGGYGNEYVNTFAGIAPVTDPRLAVVVLINEPGGDLYYGGDTAAPVFAEVMSGSLQLLNVAPDDRPVSSLASLPEKSPGKS